MKVNYNQLTLVSFLNIKESNQCDLAPSLICISMPLAFLFFMIFSYTTCETTPDLIFYIISITFEQYNENPLVTDLFLRRLLWSIVLWISGMSAFVLQNNIVCFDIPVHICTTVICIGYRVCNRVDKFHFGVVVIVL